MFIFYLVKNLPNRFGPKMKFQTSFTSTLYVLLSTSEPQESEHIGFFYLFCMHMYHVIKRRNIRNRI